MRTSAGSGTLRDARYALRQMRRAPLLTGALLLALAGGTGAGAASLSLARSASERPVPGRAPEGMPIPVQSVPVLSYAPGPADAVPVGPVPLGGPADEDQVLPRGIRLEMEESIGVLAGTLAGIAGVILALGVATTALLMLSRSSTRRGEMAMRGVLGATPRRVLGQVGVEGGVLGMLGLGAGAAVGWGWVEFMRSGAPSDLAVWLDHPWSLKVLALAAGLPLIAVLGFAAVPALAALGNDLHARVAGGARATAGPGAGGLRRALTVLAVGSSFALLCSAILLLRGFAGAGSARPALDPRDTLVAHISLGSLPVAERAGNYESVLAGIAAEPGVRAESIASQGAWVGLGTTDFVHAFIGSPVRPGIMRAARYHAVSPGYFGSLRIPLVGGREFTSADRSGAKAVVVVNEAFAHLLYPYVDPIGKHIQLGGMGLHRTWYTVVGVVRDPRPVGIGATTAPPPAVYLSLLQAPPPDVALAVRTAGNPLDTLDAVEHVVHEAAPGARIYGTGTMEEELASFSAPLSWFGMLFAALAAFTTLLAAMGLYGVVAHQVERRRRELGIRMALGARGRAVVGMVVGEGLRVTFSGLVLGLAGALCLGRLLQFFFPAVRLGDPATFALVGLLITAVSVLASFIPARAAARVDPAIALRAE